MPRKRSKPVPKEVVITRLLPWIAHNLQIAADRRGWTKTMYIQEAVRSQLERDGLTEKPQT